MLRIEVSKEELFESLKRLVSKQYKTRLQNVENCTMKCTTSEDSQPTDFHKIILEVSKSGT
jgi:hypothetical protein